MSTRYTPLNAIEILAIEGLGGAFGPQWTGPALPRPDGDAGLEEVIDTVNKLIARAQYLVQAKDGLSVTYTLNGITATAERFMLGTQEQVEQAADLRGVLTLVEQFLGQSFTNPLHTQRIVSVFEDMKSGLKKANPFPALNLPFSQDLLVAPPAAATTDDYSAFTLEDPSQFSMAWTTFEDSFRKGFPHVAEYVAAFADPIEATKQFWPTLRSTAIPYNLLVLRKLTVATAIAFQNNFGPAWLPHYTDLLNAGKLYGIDMTVFAGLDPEQASNGTVRFTPCSMALLEMDAQKNLTPIAVYVADPKNINNAQVYTQASPAWTYALLAIKTSMTVHGIWLGHVYTLHIVTAAMQMATLNSLPAGNVIYQLLAPQSHYTIPFDLLLMLGWSNLSPPTSISTASKFLTICNKYSAIHDFHSTDPINVLAKLNLNVADFTDPAIDDEPWNLYPNVQMTLRIWTMTSDYVSAVVDAGYADDAAVAADTDLTAWIGEASGPGNVIGLPRMDSKAALKAVATSVLYRITFHGMGRLRSVGSPEPVFAPNYPPCLQSATIPNAAAAVTTADLLKTYLPNTGTLGKLSGFYEIFAYNAPYVPAVPNKGAEDDLFFDAAKYPAANQALIGFRHAIQELIRELQPDWVQIGQWPRNIEL